MKVRRLVALLVLALALATLGAALTYVLPVSVALGPCMRDWTSPTAYRPRPSPLESTSMPLGSGAVKVCYGRPSARGRAVFGALVPWDQYWRFGANEPTRLFTNVAIRVGDVAVPPGRYSLYVIPGPDQWTVAVNRSTFHWGLDFSAKVLAQEVGRTVVPVTLLDQPVETLELRLEPGQDPGTGRLVSEWERTRVVIPLTAEE